MSSYANPKGEISPGNLVKQTDTAKHAYDKRGRRIRKEVFPASAVERPRVIDFVWDGDALAADIDTARGARCFVHEPGTMIPLFQEERGEVFTYVNDHLGMPKELIDPAGMVAWSAAHSAWGKVIETYAHPIGETNRGRKVESPFRLLGQVADVPGHGPHWEAGRVKTDPTTGAVITDSVGRPRLYNNKAKVEE